MWVLVLGVCLLYFTAKVCWIQTILFKVASIVVDLAALPHIFSHVQILWAVSPQWLILLKEFHLIHDFLIFVLLVAVAKDFPFRLMDTFLSSPRHGGMLALFVHLVPDSVVLFKHAALRIRRRLRLWAWDLLRAFDFSLLARLAVSLGWQLRFLWHYFGQESLSFFLDVMEPSVLLVEAPVSLLDQLLTLGDLPFVLLLSLSLQVVPNLRFFSFLQIFLSFFVPLLQFLLLSFSNAVFFFFKLVSAFSELF